MEIYNFNPEISYNIHATEDKPFCRVYVWHHNLNHTELLQLAERCGITSSASTTAKCEKRLIEQISVQMMLSILFSRAIKVQHQPSGVPYISLPKSKAPHISISHTRNTYAVSIGNEPHGIDAEYYSDKAWNLRSKFLTASEHQLLQKLGAALTPQQAATALWSAKESAFKTFCAKGYQIQTICDIALTMGPNGELFATATSNAPKAHIIVRKLNHCILTVSQYS